LKRQLQQQPQEEVQAAAAESPQVPMLGFSTGRGGSVAVSAARLEAARRQLDGGGSGDAENASANELQQAAAGPAGDSTPLLRKQMLKTRASLGGARTPGAAAAAAQGGGESGGSPLAALPAGASTTPASAPMLRKRSALQR
jgi:hypothetical protein